MFEQYLQNVPSLRKRWDVYGRLFKETAVPSGATLLREGEVSRRMFFVRKGCLRTCFTGRGKEITFQFFFENDSVASVESFRSGRPSPISIKSIEASTLAVLTREGFDRLMNDLPEMINVVLELAFTRFARYAELFISYLRDTPRERYMALLQNEPRIVERVPLRYIASCLGITPVSLSRIRRNLRIS